MNEILKDVIMVASGIAGGTLFVILKNKIFGKAKAAVVKIIPDEDKAKVKELYEKGLVPEKLYKEVCTVPTATECFDAKKAVTGVVSVSNPVLWMKDITSIFNLRKLIIVGVILSVIWGYGYYKGHVSVQPILDWHGKEEWVSLNEHYLHILKDGTMEVMASDKKTILKKITVSDLENLKKNLRPYGFILEPIAVAGGSLGESGAGLDVGIGLSWFKWFKAKIDSFITNRGFYPVGVSYGLTEHSGVGLGLGIGFKGDKRVILYYKWRF